MEAAEAAREALEILRRDGWTKGVVKDGAGRRCVGGALALAITGSSWTWDTRHPVFPAVTKVVKAQFPDRARDIFDTYPARMVALWNNMAATTFEDIEMVLEKVAAG